MFTATPLQVGSLTSNWVLFIATLIQFAIAVSYVLRCRSPHLVPGIVAILAFLLTSISYALSAADWVATLFITDSFGLSLAQLQVLINLETAASLFSDWSDPAVFLVVVFVIRDRYLAYSPKNTHMGNSGLLLAFMILSYLLALLMFTLATASTGILHSAITATNISFDAFNAQIALSNRISYAALAFYTLATIHLIPFSILVKQQAKSDRIINATVFGIVPMLCLRAIALVVLVIFRASNPTFGSINEDAFALANITSLGFFYLIAICILCYLFLSIRLWVGQEDPPQQSGGYPSTPRQSSGYPSTPRQSSGYPSTPQQSGEYPSTQQPHHRGVQLVAQYPGQWGHPTSGMLPQQGYVPPDMLYQGNPLPQDGGNYPSQLHGQFSSQPSSMVPTLGPVQTSYEAKRS